MKEKYVDANWHYPEKGEYPVAFGEYKQKVYPQIPCLVLYKGRYCVRFWNCLEEYWDNEECDDFFCRKDEVEKWMYIDSLDEQPAPGYLCFMKAPACKWHDEGECKKGLPGTPCKVKGCVAKTNNE